MRIKGRKDITRDSMTGAIIYEKDREVETRNEVRKLKTEIYNLKDQLQEVKNLLERLTHGR